MSNYKSYSGILISCSRACSLCFTYVIIEVAQMQWSRDLAAGTYICTYMYVWEVTLIVSRFPLVTYLPFNSFPPNDAIWRHGLP